MKKDTPLEKILLRYTGAAATVFGAHAAQGQADTVLTVVDTLLDRNNEFYNIDLDTNGVVDFRITQIVDSSSADLSGTVIEGRGPAANQVLGMDYGNYNYPFKLNVGDTIGPGKPFKGLNNNDRTGYLGLIAGGATYPNSQFTGGVTNGFLGVRFEGEIDSVAQSFYGWIRVDVAADLKSMTLRDFAYVRVPDSLIRAGFGSPIGVEEVTYSQPEIAQRGEYLDIKLPDDFTPQAEVHFYDMSGRNIKEFQLEGYQNSLDLKGLPKGVLIATIRSNGLEVSRRVLVY